MNDSMTQPFAVAFLTTCFEAGLTKEAAAELLQKESTDRVIRKRGEAFAEGYEKTASHFPGQLKPIITPASFEKRAAALARVGKGLRSLGRGVAGKPPAIPAAGPALARNSRAYNTGVVAGAPLRFARKHPIMAGAGALGGYGAYKHHQWSNADNDLLLQGGAPYIAPGDWNSARAGEFYDNELYNKHAPGIFEHNKSYHDGTLARMQELQNAVDTNAPGSHIALQELRALKSKRRGLENDREGFFSRLDSGQSTNQALLDRIESRQREIEDKRSSWGGLPHRLWLKATGRNPNNYYDQRVLDLEESASRTSNALNLIRDQKRLLQQGVTKHVKSTQPKTRDIQSTFFPTFN